MTPAQTSKLFPLKLLFSLYAFTARHSIGLVSFGINRFQILINLDAAFRTYRHFISTLQLTELSALVIDALGVYGSVLFYCRSGYPIHMEGRNSYSRSICAPTVASRIADARNKRETLLLAEARKGLFSETDGRMRTFYREKAKANNFLQNVRRRSSGALIAAEHDDDVKVGAARKTSFTRTENTMIDQKARRQSVEVYQTEEIQKRIQEFLARGFSSRQSKDGTKNELVETKLDALGREGSENDVKAIDTSKLIPFKVRSRISGVCFSHSHCQHLHLPPINLPDLGRKCSVAEFRRNSFGNFSKRRCRKFGIPTVDCHLSPEHQKRMTSLPLINSPREAINETSRETQKNKIMKHTSDKIIHW